MHILVAALNWGMGHASRSVPIIRALQVKGVQISLASDGVAADLFRAEFPDLVVHELPSYKVSYPSVNIYLNVLLSAWNILKAKRREQRWFIQFQKTNQLDAVISDNRYGFNLKEIPSVLITHQLRLYGEWEWANRIGEFIIRRWVRNFSEVWVPDWQGSKSLTGGMASWRYTNPPVHYIGPLSRFQMNTGNVQKDIDILVILSGPEPQRTYFEEKIVAQLTQLQGRHKLIRGTKAPFNSYTKSASNLEIIDFLPAEELQKLVERAHMQVSRSGYSTVMDLVYSGIPALMVPTPGQFEQEYLCTFLKNKGPWQFQNQENLNMENAWQKITDVSKYKSIPPSGNEASEIVDRFMKQLKISRKDYN